MRALGFDPSDRLSRSDIADLRRAYSLSVGSRRGRVVFLALVVGWILLIVVGYAADIGPTTNPNANGYLGLAWLVIAVAMVGIGIAAIRRDRRFRRTESELYSRTSPWGRAPVYMRREMLRAMIKHLVTGRDPWWMDETLNL